MAPIDGEQDRDAERSASQAMEAGLLVGTETGEPVHVIVHFTEGPAEQRLLDHPDLEVRYAFNSIPSVYATTTPSTVQTLAALEDVRFVEDAHKPIEFLLEEATVASRAKEVWDPSFDPQDLVDAPRVNVTKEAGQHIDGDDVGIAIVDTGLDATHPDFQPADKVAGNFQVTPGGVVEGGPYTDRASGHGTSVAGVAAGTGEASGGQYRGVAPGATLFSFSAVTGIDGVDSQLQEHPEGVTLHPAIALDWILENGDETTPPIDIVSNSWYCAAPACHTFNPEMAHVRLSSMLAENGTVVTWATGDFQSNDDVDETVIEARNPTPGVIGVASYDDADIGTRNGCTAELSGHGNPNDPTSWPDVAGPGTRVTTTAAVQPGSQHTRIPGVQGAYDWRTGTSMAAPHVAGVAALVLEANPSLTPGDVEYILEATAHELDPATCYERRVENLPAGLETTYLNADPTNPSDPANWKAGHGLVDAVNATLAALDYEGLPADPPEPEPVPPGMARVRDGFESTDRFYLAAGGELVTDRPEDGETSRSVQAPGEAAVFTSAPLEEPLTTGGLDAAVFVATLNENQIAPAGLFNPAVKLTVERVDDDGFVHDRLITTTDYGYRNTAIPVERDAWEGTDEPLAFQEGDRIRLTVELINPLATPPEAGDVAPWVLAWGSADRPSNVALGQPVDNVEQGSYEDCRRHAPSWCAWMDADHPEPHFRCESLGYFQLEWTGPPGSKAVLNCQDALAVCQIPEDADGWRTCKAFTGKMANSGRRGRVVECTYELPDDFEPPEDEDLTFHGRCANIHDE